MVLQTAEAPVAQTCCHYWMIQPAEGPISLGVCRLCHESREFSNSIDNRESFKEPVRIPAKVGAEESEE